MKGWRFALRRRQRRSDTHSLIQLPDAWTISVRVLSRGPCQPLGSWNMSSPLEGESIGFDDNDTLAKFPVVQFEIGKLNLDDPPRLEGGSLEHARMLANVHNALPPITVRQSTLQVIDGRHRILAAQMKGQSR